MSGAQTQTGLSKLKKKHFRVKHQKVKLFRANEPILSVFMWGVNHTINELSHVTIPVMLLPDDFRAYSKLKVDNHLFNKENMPSHFKVKEYCPLVFRNLRERFSIDDQEYKESMTRFSENESYVTVSPNRTQLKERWSIQRSSTFTSPKDLISCQKRRLRSQPNSMDSPGKSGARFYQSYDRLFILKTLTSEEVERMHSFLKQYHPYIVERHGKTLLPQYLGMYRLTVDGVEHYLVAMRNVFSNHLAVHRKFDLKGSTVDREASEKEKEKDLPTLKDNDFVKEGLKIHIGDTAKEKLLETLTADVGDIQDVSPSYSARAPCAWVLENALVEYGGETSWMSFSQFLSKLHLMDYSLLLGIHDVVRGEIETKERLEREEEENEEDEDDDSGSGLENKGAGERYVYSRSTPPDSPGQAHYEGIIPEIDIYAVPSCETAPVKEIYFLALIDVLTHYGVKKQAAKAAKTVKYGSNVDGISTCDPEQYGKRFIDFISKAIE